MFSVYFVDFFKQDFVIRIATICLAVLIGYLLAKTTGRAIHKALTHRLDAHQVELFRRFSFYSILILSILTGLNEAGINLSVLVGAAGVASVAIGFASQTTMSNLISGLFMLLERPFVVGDTIKVGQTVGEVNSLGLLSTLLRTPENMMVRIPNETLMKSEITNVTRYPLRRLEIVVGISYTADISAVQMALVECLSALAVIRKSPAPEFAFKSFSESAMQVSIGFWVERERSVEALTLAADGIKKSLEAADIEMPLPQRSLHFAEDQRLKVEVFS
jgi:small-conductance mechanosensitive channel